MFYVYVLRSESDSGFYIGFSTDLKRRLSEHKRGASFATKSRGPWKLIYYEAYTEREDAEGREKFLKSGAGRRFPRMEGILRVLGPDATLRRGYSITINEDGKIIRTVAVVRPKMKIRTRVSDGEFSSGVL